VVARPLARILLEQRVLDEETVSPGFLGFSVFLLLVLATFFLIRSMNKQLRKVPPKFEGEDEDAAPPIDKRDGEDGPGEKPDTEDGSGEKPMR
jgi:hypothetical protein